VVGDIDMARDAEELKFVAGYLGHGSYFYDELTCVDNMTFFLKALRKDASGARGALEQCGIGGRLHKTPFGKLSAGQKKRVGLAYLVARAPSLWLLDEPHTSLDQSGRALLEEIVAHEKKAGSCVLFSSHEQDVALPLADRGVVMGGGIIVEELDHKETSTLSLLSESGDAHVA
jgi:heme exporter protein A